MHPPDDRFIPPQRALFDLPEGLTFLDCANMSPRLREVAAVGIEAVRRREPWNTRPSDWFTGAEALRAAAATLHGADPDGIALVPAVSYGIAVAAVNVPVKRGENVVLLDEQFPSNVYAWRARADREGATVRVVRKAPSDGWTEVVLEAIDADTAVVAVPNCHWTDGALVDLVRVGARAREEGAALVVDASQSLGAYPLSVEEVRPDFVVSVGYKWQLGPYGLGYLYAAPGWREAGRPLEASWLTRAGAEDFAGLVEYTDDYRAGARRFDMGEYPQFVLVPMALAALSRIIEWGVANIQATLRRMTDRIAEESKVLGLAVLPAERRVGHLIGIRFPGRVPPRLPGRLEQERVHVSVRGSAIRVAPHLYNDEADIERLLAVLREFSA
ncbi:MAG: aminotransferase class V-fold PLP-dependent enzyme [Gemmatimonadota bacterium]